MRGQSHEPTKQTREQVVAFKRDGMQQEFIAATLKISADTLARKYRAELDSVSDTEALEAWRRKFEGSARQRMLRPDCAPVLVIFGLKSQCGWREQVPLDPEKRKPEDMTNDELRAVVAERSRLRRARDGAGEATRRAGESA